MVNFWAQSNERGYSVLEIKDVSKRYESLVAAHHISLQINQGDVVGLLGPNGAGKTTLIKLIAGFLKPDSGQITPTQAVWPTIGFKPERLLYPNQMRVHEYLKMIANLSNAPGNHAKIVADSLAQVQLSEATHKRIGDCSKGMRQRLGLAQILIGDPQLLLLDEPSNGLDPQGQSDICRLIQQLKGNGKTIILCSHQLKEITQVCTRIVILKRGRIIYDSSMADALSLRPHVMIQSNQDLTPIAGLLQSLHAGVQVNGELVILSESAIGLRRHVLSIILGTGFDVLRVDQKRVTLEEIYAEAVK